MGKGEIARYKQFLPFPQCFQKACFPGASKGVIVWEWVNPFPNSPWFLHVCSTSLLKTVWGKREIDCNEQFFLSPTAIFPFPTMFSKRVKNIVGYEENAGKQRFLLFPQWF